MKIELREIPEKWVTVFQQTTNKSIGHKYRSIISKKPPDYMYLLISHIYYNI